jgi:hypothetical protein
MRTFKIRLRRSVVLETEIAVDAETAIGAMDAARDLIGKGDLPEFALLQEVKPCIVAVEEVPS